jgi:hypothetical protein
LKTGCKTAKLQFADHFPDDILMIFLAVPQATALRDNSPFQPSGFHLPLAKILKKG